MTKASDMNRDQLRKVAAERGIAGRSTMPAPQLREEVRKAMQSAPSPMNAGARMDAYARTNGTKRLTAPQQRRVNKKARGGR